MQESALSLYATMLKLPNEHAAPFNLITIPEPYCIRDTISLQNAVLELVYEAKRKLTPDCMLRVNFGWPDLFGIIKNFE